MKASLLYWFRIFRDAAVHWASNDVFAYAGALAFYTVFSLAPVMIIAVAIVGLVFGHDAAQGEIVAQLQGAIGRDAAQMIETAVANSRIERAGIAPTLIGIGTVLVGATTVFAQMQRSLNAIWQVAPRPSRSSIVLLIKSRILSLAVVLALGFVLLVSLLLSVIVRAITAFAEEWLPIPSPLVLAFDTAVSLLVVSLLLATIFRVLPDVRLNWRDVWLGALITAILFSIGRAFISMYLAYTATATTYGAAGSLVVLLLWVNYTSLILLFGAAFTRAHMMARGKPIIPNSTAVAIHTEITEHPPRPAHRASNHPAHAEHT